MVNSRFAVAIHILALLDASQEMHTTSEFLAQSIGTNAVVVRRIAKLLENAGLIEIHAGVGGSELRKPLAEIRLLDVYRAVENADANRLFAIHEHPHPACPVGANIQAILEESFATAQRAMEQVLAQQSMAGIVQGLAQRQATILSKSSI
ncbi:MAG: Rrf2 family transcriptional regulator [Caldilineaceae bacterium]|nr:Rrf2 family transcriptional regulator [Caldilineaceae bacterium]